MKKNQISRTVLLLAGILASGSIAPAASDNQWDGGDRFWNSAPFGVDYLIYNSRRRSINFTAETITNLDTSQRGCSGEYFTGLEFFHVDDRSAVVNGTPNYVNVGGSFNSFVVVDEYKPVTTIGATAAAISAQPSSMAATHTENSPRQALIGSSSYVGLRDHSDSTIPGTFYSGILSTMVGSSIAVELDAHSNTTIDNVSGDSTGLDIIIQNGVSSSGALGVKAKDAVGIDIKMETGFGAAGDYAQHRSFQGLRVQHPERFSESFFDSYAMDDYDQKSYGVIVESAATPAAGEALALKPSLVQTEYAGVRTEASLEVAGEHIEDPLNVVEIGPRGYVNFPIDRALLWLDINDAPLSAGGSDSPYAKKLPDGVTGQRLTIYMDGQGLNWYESAKLRLETPTLYQPAGAILELLYIDGSWRQVSFSNP